MSDIDIDISSSDFFYQNKTNITTLAPLSSEHIPIIIQTNIFPLIYSGNIDISINNVVESHSITVISPLLVIIVLIVLLSVTILVIWLIKRRK